MNIHAVVRGAEIAWQVVRVIVYTLSAVVMLGVCVALPIALIVWPELQDFGGEKPVSRPAVSPSPSPSTPMNWTWRGSQCADGWLSVSIGRQGACSHHGGVVAVWLADDGTEARCRNVDPPSTVEAAAVQMEKFGRIVC